MTSVCSQTHQDTIQACHPPGDEEHQAQCAALMGNGGQLQEVPGCSKVALQILQTLVLIASAVLELTSMQIFVTRGGRTLTVQASPTLTFTDLAKYQALHGHDDCRHDTVLLHSSWKVTCFQCWPNLYRLFLFSQRISTECSEPPSLPFCAVVPVPEQEERRKSNTTRGWCRRWWHPAPTPQAAWWRG